MRRPAFHVLAILALVLATSLLLGTPVTWCRVSGILTALSFLAYVVWFAERYRALLMHIFLDTPMPQHLAAVEPEPSIIVRWGIRAQD